MKRVPKTDRIIDQAIASVDRNILKSIALRKNLNEGIIALHDIAYSIFLQEQEKARNYALEKWSDLNENKILELGKTKDKLQFAKDLCRMFLPFANSLEKRFGNSRRSRAGSTLEQIIRILLLMIEIPCQKPSKEAKKKLKRIDIVVPNQKVALEEPDKAYFISCKRTLRERWKQAIPERKMSWRVFLVTLDEDLSKEKAKEIKKEGFIVYVPDDVKKQKHLRGKAWIRKLSALPVDLKI
jgi:hypothetical protein